jgi:hypothetical protein
MNRVDVEGSGHDLKNYPDSLLEELRKARKI